MGGSPDAVPSRYAQGNPLAHLPVPAREVLVAAAALTPQEAADYRSAAAARGDQVEVIVLNDTGHFDMLSPVTPAGMELERAIFQAPGAACPRP